MRHEGPVVAASGVVKRYGAFAAVDGVSLEIPRGTCYALLGPNGAGKTTLSRMVGAVLPRDEGELRVFGLDPWERQSAVKARLGWVMQEDALDEELDVLGNLEVYGLYFGMRGRAFREKVASLLGFVGLSGRERMPTQALSGGMRRRLCIARALLNDPELLLLDEPTTGLDPQVRHTIWAALRRLRTRGMTIVLTTHYMEEAAQLADRVGILHRGRLIAEDRPAALVERHVPRYVLEVEATDREGLEARGPDGGFDGARVERHGDRLFVFHPDEARLRGWVADLGCRTAVVRPSTLEDVFLELTGRKLDE